MRSILRAEFTNVGNTKIIGSYVKITIEKREEPIKFSLDPGQNLYVDISLSGFCYYAFLINKEGEDGDSDCFEVRSISDFLLLQQYLEKNFKLKFTSGRPNYRDYK